MSISIRGKISRQVNLRDCAPCCCDTPFSVVIGIIDVASPISSVLRLRLFFRRQKNIRTPTIASTATPPTTPPTMAPMLVFFGADVVSADTYAATKSGLSMKAGVKSPLGQVAGGVAWQGSVLQHLLRLGCFIKGRSVNPPPECVARTARPKITGSSATGIRPFTLMRDIESAWLYIALRTASGAWIGSATSYKVGPTSTSIPVQSK